MLILLVLLLLLIIISIIKIIIKLMNLFGVVVKFSLVAERLLKELGFESYSMLILFYGADIYIQRD